MITQPRSYAGLAAACLCILSVGCATVKPYPFCSFDGIPADDEFAGHLEHTIDAITSMAGSDQIVAKYVEVQNRRWLLVKTSSLSHRSIKDAWPPLACISKKPYSGDLGARKYRTCLLTVERNINAETIVAPKIGPEFENEEIDSDSLIPSRLLWCNGWESL